jgi:hypothetical protein
MPLSSNALSASARASPRNHLDLRNAGPVAGALVLGNRQVSGEIVPDVEFASVRQRLRMISFSSDSGQDLDRSHANRA